MAKQIAKLYILDEHEQEVGRLVLDMDHLINMYRQQKGDVEQSDDQGEPVPISDNDELVEVESDMSAWFRSADGRLYLRRHKPK